MGCNCNNKRKQDFDYIKNLAIAYAKGYEHDVQIHTYMLAGVGIVYDFEELGKDRGAGLVEIIRWQDFVVRNDKSEPVLQDTELVEPGIAEVKPSKGKRKSVAKPLDVDGGEVLS